MNFHFESHVDEFLSELDEAKKRALETIGLVAEGYAKDRCPVDTGRLSGSITHAVVDSSTAVIGTNVEYGKYVELGTSRQDPHPYLRPAATEHTEQYKNIVESEMRHN